MTGKEKEKTRLTSEKLKAKFPNQFDLVNSAIKCARDMIRSGNEPSQDVENVNVAFLAIESLSDPHEEI